MTLLEVPLWCNAIHNLNELQVVSERDEAKKKIVQLNTEIDELKDHVEELRDRLSNFKVQAQAKEVSL